MEATIYKINVFGSSGMNPSIKNMINTESVVDL